MSIEVEYRRVLYNYSINFGRYMLYGDIHKHSFFSTRDAREKLASAPYIMYSRYQIEVLVLYQLQWRREKKKNQLFIWSISIGNTLLYNNCW